VPHEAWPELREISFGIFEGKSYDELNGRADYAAWLAGDWFGNVPPGGESFAQAQARILAGLARMQAQGEDILAVVHGGTVLTIMQALFPEEEKNGSASGADSDGSGNSGHAGGSGSGSFYGDARGSGSDSFSGHSGGSGSLKKTDPYDVDDYDDPDDFAEEWAEEFGDDDYDDGYDDAYDYWEEEYDD
jgi:hypothetical protein